MLSLSDNTSNQADYVEALTLDDFLNIDNLYIEQMVSQIYPFELQLNKAYSSDTEAPFLDLDLSITNGIVTTKNYDKRDEFNFEIVYFPFLGGDDHRSLPMVYRFCNLFVLQEYVLMLITLTTETTF